MRWFTAAWSELAKKNGKERLENYSTSQATDVE